MRVQAAGLALAGAALAGAVALALGPGVGSSTAATATTWTVRPGGAVTAAAGKAALKDTTTGAELLCNSAHMSGMLKAGSGLQGDGVGSIATATFHCPSPVVPPFTLAARGLPWQLNLAAYDAGTRVSRGTISHVELVLTGPSCSAVVNGTSGTTPDGVIAVSYSSKTAKLAIHTTGGDLHWYHVSGCAGLVGDGHPATLSAAYALSPPQVITNSG